MSGTICFVISMFTGMMGGAVCWAWGFHAGVNDRFGILPRIQRNEAEYNARLTQGTD